MAPSVGYQGQMALAATNSFSSSSSWLEFISEGIAKQGVILDTNAIRGSRSKDGSRVRTGNYKVGGQVSMYVDINNLDVLLNYALGAGPTTHVYSLTDSLNSFYILLDRVAKVFTYGPCFISKATFSASASDPLLKMTLDIEAETETIGNSGTFTSATSGITVDTNRPYVFSDLASGVTVAGSTYSVFGFELTIDNHLLADRFVNELTRSAIPPSDRTVTCKLTTPYTSTETGLYNVAVGSFQGASFVFTNAEETIIATQSVLTFTVPGLFQYPARSPLIHGKTSEITLELDGTARADIANAHKELTISNVHG